MAHDILTGRKSLLNASSGGYSYDSLNRLKTVTRDSVLSAVYTYDAGGRRVRSWDSVDYVYGGLNVIDEVSGVVHELHIYAGGMYIASNTTGTVEYYHVDHLGSTRLKTNSGLLRPLHYLLLMVISIRNGNMNK